MNTNDALHVFEAVQEAQKVVGIAFEPFKNYEHLQDYPREAQGLMRVMQALSDAQGIALQLMLGGAK